MLPVYQCPEVSPTFQSISQSSVLLVFLQQNQAIFQNMEPFSGAEETRLCSATRCVSLIHETNV